jgi:hypothetical protein
MAGLGLEGSLGLGGRLGGIHLSLAGHVAGRVARLSRMLFRAGGTLLNISR